MHIFFCKRLIHFLLSVNVACGNMFATQLSAFQVELKKVSPKQMFSLSSFVSSYPIHWHTILRNLSFSPAMPFSPSHLIIFHLLQSQSIQSHPLRIWLFFFLWYACSWWHLTDHWLTYHFPWRKVKGVPFCRSHSAKWSECLQYSAVWPLEL